jgi:hypothetical protein
MFHKSEVKGYVFEVLSTRFSAGFQLIFEQSLLSGVFEDSTDIEESIVPDPVILVLSDDMPCHEVWPFATLQAHAK